MVWLYRDCSGRAKQRWRPRANITAVFFPLYVIMESVFTAVLTLRGKVTERILEDTREVKLTEIIGGFQLVRRISISLILYLQVNPYLKLY